MAKEINWDEEILSPEEKEALENYRKNGVPVYGAPIVIENELQLTDLGLTWDQVKTWYVGPVKLIVHITPADESTYSFLVNEIRREHRDAFRQARCMVPGKSGRLIRCPESNRCSACPFPECREQSEAPEISWDSLIEDGGDFLGDTSGMDNFWGETYATEIDALQRKKNPLIAEVFRMKTDEGLTTKAIAEKLGITERNVTYYFDEGKKIAKEYMKQ